MAPLLGSNSWDFNFDHTGFYERLTRESWKSAVVPTGPRTHAGLMGNHRAAPPVHLKGMAKDRSLMKDIARVNAYGFRGDTRDPSAIKAANGFSPPATRTDEYYLENAIIPNFQQYMKQRFDKDIPKSVVMDFLKKNSPKTRDFVQYELWRAMMDQEKYHLGRMISNEALKGYTSTSKSVSVAKGYAKTNGFVYVLKVTGAFLIPHKSSGHALAGTFSEEEMAMPGPVLWTDIVAFRKVDSFKKFMGPIFLRDSFATGGDKHSAEKVLSYMSGKKQSH